MAMVANSEQLCRNGQVYNLVAHLDEDYQTCSNKANYGILRPAMLTYGHLWLETSRLTNSITVTVDSIKFVFQYELWAFRAHCANNGGIWT